MSNQDKPRWHYVNPECVNCDGAGAFTDHNRPEEDGPGPCGVCWDYKYQHDLLLGDDTPTVSQFELLRAFVGFAIALGLRDDCPECDGRGFTYVYTEEGGTEGEECGCSRDAIELTKHHAKFFSIAMAEFVWLHGYDDPGPTEQQDGYPWAAGILEDIIRGRYGPTD
jgi:hypothetical protein